MHYHASAARGANTAGVVVAINAVQAEEGINSRIPTTTISSSSSGGGDGGDRPAVHNARHKSHHETFVVSCICRKRR
jgi:uncharacterized membrane protein YsdA (DUF1294 family)